MIIAGRMAAKNEKPVILNVEHTPSPGVAEPELRLAGTAGFFDALGFRPGRLFAAAASVAEIASGVLLAIGLLGPVAGALIVSVMVVAAISVHWQHGVFAASNGIEVPLLYGAGAAALTLTGPGAYSLDSLFGLDAFWTPEVTWAALAIGLVGGLVNLALRRPLVAVAA